MRKGIELMLTADQIAAIPRPQTEADYAACYRVNLAEARENLERAVQRFRALKRAGNITERPEGGYVFADAFAKAAHGDVARWRSDLEHWHIRMVEAEKRMRAAAVLEPDRRLPPEREPGDDDETVPF